MTKATSNRILSILQILLVLSTNQISAQQNPITAIEAVTSGNNEFTMDLHDVLRKSLPSENLIVSPFSISAAMAMLQVGARAETAVAIRRAMKFPQKDEDLHTGFKSLFQELKEDSKVTLKIANKLYPAEGFMMKPEFVNTLRTSYEAEPQQLNFYNPLEASKTINQFVANVTHGKIKDLLKDQDIDYSTKLVLVNGIYFKGTWQYQFDKSSTYKAPFYISGDKSVKVDMMKLTSASPQIFSGHLTDLDADCAVLPYAGDKNLNMILLVPSSKTQDLSVMEEKLKQTTWTDIFSHLKRQNLEVHLPKFKVESSFSLADALTKLGAGVIFDSRSADFSGISEERRLFVSKAIHKAFIEVNEEGSEAAAATAVSLGIKTIVLPPPTPRVIIADRPFIAIIARVKLTEEARSGGRDTMPLFMSRILNPSQ